MTIVELSRTFNWTIFDTVNSETVVWVNDRPGIWYTSFKSEFGLTDEAFWIVESAEETVNYVSSVVIDDTTNLSSVASISALDADPAFFWDHDAGLLYVRLANFDPPDLHDVAVGRTQGFTDKSVVYVDDLYYAPLVTSIPAFDQQQDLADYDKLAFISGTVEMLNVGGDLNVLRTDIVYGNNLFIAHLDDDKVGAVGAVTRSDLTYIAALYVEDYNIGLRQVSFAVQDRRKAQNISIPTETFELADYPNLEDDLDGDVIPLAYGALREIPAIPVTGAQASGAVTYRAAVTLSSLGTVQTLQDDVWTTVTPTSSDVAGGEFTLAEADARNASGAIRDCKLVGSEGISVTYASDVIKDLFDRYLNITYNSSNYDTTEWEAEETSLSTIGLYWDDSVKMFEAIREVQNGANVGFRFEFLPNGKRTIRVDDWARAKRWHIPNTDIRNITDLNVETDSELLAAEFLVKYAFSYVSEKYRKYLDDSEAQTVLQKYRQQPTLEVETALTTEADAQERTAYLEERFSEIRGQVSLLLMAKDSDYREARIYDIVTVELGPGTFDLDAGTIDSDREFYGIRRGQIIAVDPDFEAGVNEVRVVLTAEELYDHTESVYELAGGSQYELAGGTIYLVREAVTPRSFIYV